MNRYQFEKLSEPTRKIIPDFPWNCDNNLRIAGSSPSWPICNLCSRSFFKIASTTLNCNIRAEWLVEKISFLVFIFSWVHFLLFRRTPERQKSTKTFAKTFLQVFIRDFCIARVSRTVWPSGCPCTKPGRSPGKLPRDPPGIPTVQVCERTYLVPWNQGWADKARHGPWIRWTSSPVITSRFFDQLRQNESFNSLSSAT